MKTGGGGRKRARPHTLDEARAEGEAKARPSALAAGRVALACTFCHGRLRRPSGVFCAACLAPHHGACHAEHGRCAAPGCREVRIVAPFARPDRARSGLGRVPGPLRLAAATWLLTAAVLVWSVARERCAARPAWPGATARGLHLASEARRCASEAERATRAHGPRAALHFLPWIQDLGAQARAITDVDPGAAAWIDDAAWRVRMATRTDGNARLPSYELGRSPCVVVDDLRLDPDVPRWGLVQEVDTFRLEPHSSLCGRAAVDAAHDDW